ncbi:MAG: hypothetical protein WBQ66_15350 [Blastocatellia bacterium]
MFNRIAFIMIAGLLALVGSTSTVYGAMPPSSPSLLVKMPKNGSAPFRVVKVSSASLGSGSDMWLRDLAIQIEITSNKPVYMAKFYLTLPQITVGGNPFGFRVFYGRPQLGALNPPEPGDQPLYPGDRITFKLTAPAYATFCQLRSANQWPIVSQIVLGLQYANFGDGSGYLGVSRIGIGADPEEACTCGRFYILDQNAQYCEVALEQCPRNAVYLSSASSDEAKCGNKGTFAYTCVPHYENGEDGTPYLCSEDMFVPCVSGVDLPSDNPFELFSIVIGAS